MSGRPSPASALDMERRLLAFVRRIDAAGRDSRPPIDAETALFEEGVIDSLRLLDLIAFVEELTGSRVPDSAVRLANFRSVRAMATAFGGGGDDGRSRVGGAPAELGPPTVVFERSAARAGAGSPVPELAARGELTLFAPGRAVFHGRPARLLDYFDTVARSWAAEVGAAERRYPALVPRELLMRAGRTLDPPPGGPVRPSAACYHVYGALAGARLVRPPALITARGRCFRAETELDPARGRLRVFEMREIVAIGTRADAEELRWEMIGKVRALMEELDLAGRLETANDLFFLPESGSRGRRLMQRLLPLKYELRVPVAAGAPACAAASFNHHLDFFGRRFDIRLASGAPAHSCCTALGLERWVLAFLAQHGTDARSWPTPVRDFCAREGKHVRAS